MGLSVAPTTVKAAMRFVKTVHRRLPQIQGGMWAVRLDWNDDTVGVAIVGHPARVWKDDTLVVLRVAVVEGTPNGCSMLYGACSRAAKAMGAQNLVTYTHTDEPGTSLKAAGWHDDGLTDGGEHDRPSRRRGLAIDATPKRRWFAPWSERITRRGRGWLKARDVAEDGWLLCREDDLVNAHMKREKAEADLLALRKVVSDSIDARGWSTELLARLAALVPTPTKD